MGIFSKNKQSVKQEALLTEDQKKAQSALLKIGQGGSVGGATLGEGFSGSLGEFDQDPLAQQANALIGARLGGANSNVDSAASVLRGLATDDFDENSDLFKSFTKSIQRAQKEGGDVLNREAAIQGNRFGTAIAEEKGLLAERGQDALADFQARQFESFLNRKQVSAGQLADVARLQEDVQAGRISQAQAAGEVRRQIKDSEAKANLNEFLRTRGEKLGQIDVLQGLFNRNVQFGVKNLETESPSAFSKFAGVALGGIGQGVGLGIGSKLGGNLLEKFPFLGGGE
jgi:hypothetical protein